MLTAIQLAHVMKETGKRLSELASEVPLLPQVMVNVEVSDKDRALNHPKILDEIDAVTNELGSEGRVLVRPSGTEPLVRVMIEAETKEICETYAHRIATVIDQELGTTE